tara:strand:- start:84578 stop:86794 length:2217 start_codon:yes stop_codon:yes gene_type:complete
MSEIATDIPLSEKTPQTIDELVESLEGHYSKDDLETLRKCYEFSEKAHDGQVRRSGEPYISHPLSVAGILAELRLDMSTICTGLLHDTVEDTDVDIEDIEERFGKSVAHLVDGVTKITQMKFRNTHEKQGENIRKMIVAMGKDVRVILVKLADRLHNMRTLNHMPYQKQARIAQETLDIYAPLASRLGINSIKIELEDLSFRYGYPDMYYELAQKVAKKKKEREKYIDDVKRILNQVIVDRSKIKFEIYGRPKHLYSIYKKITHRNLDYEQIYDILAFRVIVGTLPECYEVLGLVHALWKPIPGRFKDFIAMPKANNYQSLHTTVIGPGAERIEIQIRTKEMHLIAEKGIAAHWTYKEESKGNKSAAGVDAIEKYNWLRDLVSMHQQTDSSDEFLENVKTELFDTEIYVFTPKGDVKEFPDGATPIDFAYAVHTDVGNRIVAARVNGKLVPLKYELQNGDNVEVITSKNQTPSKDWLNYSVTTRARSKIRHHVKQEQRQRSFELGKELIEKSLRKAGTSVNKLLKGPEFEKFLKDQGCPSIDDMYVKVGYGKMTPKFIIETLIPDTGVQEEEQGFLQKAFQSAARKKKKSNNLISVDGMSDVMVRFAKCCNPIPGDSILGFITLGRGIVIHRSDCPKAYEFDQDRQIDVEWAGSDNTPVRQVRLRVACYNNPGLLKDMSEVFARNGVNINGVNTKNSSDGRVVCHFEISVRNTQHLSETMAELQKVKGVLGVSRLTKS